MKLLATATTLFSLASVVLAYEASSVPCLMWSPKNYIVDNAKSNSQIVLSSSDATSTILSSLSSDICSAKVITLVNQPEIQSTTLARHGYENAFSQLKEYNSEATTRTQIKYISNGVDVEQVAKQIASQCDAEVSILDPSAVTRDNFVAKNAPVVAIVPLPSSNNDVGILEDNNKLLDQVLETVKEEVHDDYVVIYTSSSAKSSSSQTLKRRAPQAPQDLPIFKKYQLFTPGVFMVLGVVFLFMFIAGTGITWLVGIQTPLRFEGPANKQKKQQ
ncbi:vacuolar ATP synthase subunit S1-domain-containing protein [Choanephora cucurbitarum]|nr:vacuolar ATP synthase subunit S1-domain-containing protein [Choanephora cucurbitarum]